jgi:hypothetical protein
MKTKRQSTNWSKVSRMANTLPSFAIDSPNVRSLTGNGLLLFWKPTNDNAACNSNLNAWPEIADMDSEHVRTLTYKMADSLYINH